MRGGWSVQNQLTKDLSDMCYAFLRLQFATLIYLVCFLSLRWLTIKQIPDKVEVSDGGCLVDCVRNL